MKKITFLILIVFSCSSFSQTIYDWYDTSPDNNWRQGDPGARWTGGLFDEPPIGKTLRFNNNHELNMNNNISNYTPFIN